MRDIGKKRFAVGGSVAFILFLVLSPLCKADEVYTFVIKKQEEKAKYRWSLADWLDTRDRMRVQDLWLAMHSPSPYEFYLGGNFQMKQAATAWEINFAAFSSIFGLEARYEMGTDKRLFGIFDLRFFGYHDQGTNLTLQLGVRQIDNGVDALRNGLLGLSLTFYMNRYFGLEGMYRYFFVATPNNTGQTPSGARMQGGAFLDFKFLRLYGDYFSDQSVNPSETGVIVGTKLYF